MTLRHSSLRAVPTGIAIRPARSAHSTVGTSSARPAHERSRGWLGRSSVSLAACAASRSRWPRTCTRWTGSGSGGATPRPRSAGPPFAGRARRRGCTRRGTGPGVHLQQQVRQVADPRCPGEGVADPTETLHRQAGRAVAGLPGQHRATISCSTTTGPALLRLSFTIDTLRRERRSRRTWTPQPVHGFRLHPRRRRGHLAAGRPSTDLVNYGAVRRRRDSILRYDFRACTTPLVADELDQLLSDPRASVLNGCTGLAGLVERVQ
jgi:hypothetical protein